MLCTSLPEPSVHRSVYCDVDHVSPLTCSTPVTYSNCAFRRTTFTSIFNFLCSAYLPSFQRVTVHQVLLASPSHERYPFHTEVGKEHRWRPTMTDASMEWTHFLRHELVTLETANGECHG